MKHTLSVSYSRSLAPVGFVDLAVRGTSLWGKALILAAVLSLSVSLVTRHSAVQPSGARATKTAASQSFDAQRQHLLNDGIHWSAPSTTFVLVAAEEARAGIPSAFGPDQPIQVRLTKHTLYFNAPSNRAMKMGIVHRATESGAC